MQLHDEEAFKLSRWQINNRLSQFGRLITNRTRYVTATEMWLSIIYIIASYLGTQKSLRYKPKGVHRTNVAAPLSWLYERVNVKILFFTSFVIGFSHLGGIYFTFTNLLFHRLNQDVNFIGNINAFSQVFLVLGSVTCPVLHNFFSEKRILQSSSICFLFL